MVESFWLWDASMVVILISNVGASAKLLELLGYVCHEKTATSRGLGLVLKGQAQCLAFMSQGINP